MAPLHSRARYYTHFMRSLFFAANFIWPSLLTMPSRSNCSLASWRRHCDRELHCIRTDLASKRNFILCGRCYLVYIFHPKKQKHSCPKSQFVSSAMCIHTWCHSILYNSYVIRTFQKKKMTYIVNNRHLTTLTNCIDKDISNTENTYYAEFIDIDLVL